MFNLKGFMAIGAFADNAVGVVAPLGELSTNSLTYAKEKGYYTNAEAKDVALVAFISTDDNGNKVTTPAAIALNALRVGQWVYTQSITGSLTADGEEVARSLINEFETSADNLTLGDMVTDGKYWMPSWVSWTVKGDATAQIKVWFSDDAFQRQFTDYEITVVPPVPEDQLDKLFDGAYEVSGLLQRKKQSEIMFQIQEARGKYPETYLRTEEYFWIDPTDENTQIESAWTVLIYGIGGNNTDNIKDTLTRWILARSKHSREEWAGILPDLFKSTETVITPLWDQYSVVPQTLTPGIHSPVVNINRALEVARATAVGYPSAHVSQNLNIFGFVYKSLAMLAVGGPDNRDAIYEFGKRFPDYMAVGTNTNDFNRISPTTQAFIEKLMDLVLVAEEMTEYSDIPVGMTRIIREGVMYVAANYNDVQYLVVAKAYFAAETPTTDVELG